MAKPSRLFNRTSKSGNETEIKQPMKIKSNKKNISSALIMCRPNFKGFFYSKFFEFFFNQTLPFFLFRKKALWLGTMNSPLGNSALIVLPYSIWEMKNKTPEEREEQVLKGVDLAGQIGAKKIAFAGWLPSLLGHFQRLSSTKLINHKKRIITDQTMTGVGVGAVFEKLLTKTHCDILSVVGCGAIGRSSLILLLEKILQPKKIILCDLPAKKYKLQRLAEEIEKTYSISTDTAFYGEETFLKIYEGDMLLGAVSSKNTLHPGLLKKGAVLVDDSFPPIAPLRSAIDRMKNQKDILILSGGKMLLPSSHFQSEIWQIRPLLSLFLKQIGNQGLPGCWLEAIVQSHQSAELKKNIGPPGLKNPLSQTSHKASHKISAKAESAARQKTPIVKENILKAWELKDSLNLTLPDFHFFKYSIPPDLTEQVYKYRQEILQIEPAS